MVEELLGHILHVGADGGDDLQPLGEGGGVAGQELTEGVTVVRAMVLRLTKPVHQDDAVLRRDLAQTSQTTQRLKNAPIQR